MLEKRSVRLWTYAAVGLAGGWALASLPLLLFGRTEASAFPNPERILELTIMMTLAMAWAAAFAILYFRNSDEFIQAGSRVAWYWGGIIGIAASAPIFVFVEMGGLHWLWPSSPVGPELARAFAMGFALPVILQLAGFLIVAAWWQLSKR